MRRHQEKRANSFFNGRCLHVNEDSDLDTSLLEIFDVDVNAKLAQLSHYNWNVPCQNALAHYILKYLHSFLFENLL